MSKTMAVYLGVVLGWSDASGAWAAVPIPFPYFTPDPKPVMYGPPLPDPDVPTCAANDRACLEAHDAAALSAALADHDDARCGESRTPAACRAAFEMITGNVGMRADAILDDPCSWVVLVDHGIATIESKRTGARRRYVDRGWKPMTFLGKCDLSKLASYRGEAAELPTPLPTWVVRRTSPGGAGPSLRAQRPAPPAPVGPPASVLSAPLPAAAAPVPDRVQPPAADTADPAPAAAATAAAFMPVSTTKP
jgi:hypothetical protein